MKPIEKKLDDQEVKDDLTPQGGRGRTHGVSPGERRGDRHELEAS